MAATVEIDGKMVSAKNLCTHRYCPKRRCGKPGRLYVNSKNESFVLCDKHADEYRKQGRLS